MPSRLPFGASRFARRCAVVLTVVLLTAAGGCSSSAPALPAQPPASVGTALNRSVPPLIAQLPLIDDAGRTTNLEAFRGKTVVLTDFLTLCQDVCPMTSANYAEMDRAVSRAGLGSKVQFVELTVDPQRDTPARLHAYRRLFDAPANWSFLTADPAVIARIWAFFGASYSRGPEDTPAGTDWLTHKRLTYDVDHNDVLVFLDQTGTERFVISGLPNTTGHQPPAALERFLNDLGRTHLRSPGAGSWTVSGALSVLSWLTKSRIPGG